MTMSPPRSRNAVACSARTASSAPGPSIPDSKDRPGQPGDLPSSCLETSALPSRASRLRAVHARPSGPTDSTSSETFRSRQRSACSSVSVRSTRKVTSPVSPVASAVNSDPPMDSTANRTDSSSRAISTNCFPGSIRKTGSGSISGTPSDGSRCSSRMESSRTTTSMPSVSPSTISSA